MNHNPIPTPSDFIRTMITDDTTSGKYGGRVVTRFPPEPNGYLHIGHAKSICLNFGVAAEFNGKCHLRFDDTNPTTEDTEYVESIKNDVHWLGFDWGQNLFHASDYFETMYNYAVELIRRGKAYVDDSSEEEIRRLRGTISEKGTPSPNRERTIQENLDLFEKMRRGEFDDGSHVLRAKIDLAATNMKMRDPLLYRIRKGAHHYRLADSWCIYPFYDFAHCLSDAIEGITHSLCTLEFENNRELYDWVLDNVGIEKPRTEQTEFARLNLSYTVMSKRRLLRLVQEKYVNGWDDPRMPTISGMRRRGIRASAIRAFCEEIGVARTHNVIDIERFEHILRDDLNLETPRVLCVLRPIEVIIDNYPEGQTEEFEAPYYPRDVGKEGSRKLLFSKRIFIESDDFTEAPPKGWFRLSPGTEVRLRYAYIIRCDKVVKDDDGNVVRLHCSYDPSSRGGQPSDGRKVKGTIHWVSAEHSAKVQVRLYDRLFLSENPDAEEGDFISYMNPNSLQVIEGARLEMAAAKAKDFERFQFERQGYFAHDPDSRPDALVFNRIVTLRDTWAKRSAPEVEKQEKTQEKPSIPEAPGPKATAEKTAESRAFTAEQKAASQRLLSLGLTQREGEILLDQDGLLGFFDAALDSCKDAPAVAKWIINELLRELKSRSVQGLPFGGKAFGTLVALVEKGTITGTAGKIVLEAMLAGQGSPEEVVKKRGLDQVASPEKLGAMIDDILSSNAAKVKEYQEGKVALLGYFVGLVMRASQGKANAEMVKSLLEDKLKS